MTNTADTPNQGIGLREAAAQFESFLTASEEADTHEPEHAAASNAAEVEETEAPAASETPGETQPSDNADTAEDDVADDVADEAEGADEEEGAGEEEADADNPPEVLDVSDKLDKLVTVKIDGKEEQVTLKEALNGYQRTADYTRKSMALAEDRKAVAAEKEAIALERQQYAQLLPVLIEQIKSSMEQEPDWQALIDSDPAEYVRQERLWREKQDRLAAAQAEQRRLAEIQAQEQYEALVAEVNNHKAKLLEKMPEWRNPDKWNAVRDKLLAYGEKLGFAQDELKQTYDHRAVIALYKAMKYDELMAKRPTPQKPNSPKPVRPGTTGKQPGRQASDLTRAKQRLAKTGRVRDAASLFEQLLA